MNKSYWLFPLLIFVLLGACAAPETPTQAVALPTSADLAEATLKPTSIPTAVPPSIQFDTPMFIFQGEDPSIPIVTHDPSPQIENKYINPGAVLFHDGQFHMFFNSFTNWPGIVQIGYMISTDGYLWAMVQDAPVFTTDQVPFGEGKADVSSALVLDDGTWVLYFHTVGDGEIGLATSASPLGPWTVNPDPILLPGPQGTWDQRGLGWPSVGYDGSAYFMYYGAQNRGGFSIGLATSADGLHWEKYNDPDTIEEKFAESDPVLLNDADWESIKVDRPRVVASPDGFVMIYQGGTAVEDRGLAISEDGIHWENYTDNPVFNSAVFPIPNARTWDTNLLYHDGTYYYFMEIGTLGGTDLYLTTHEGTLRK